MLCGYSWEDVFVTSHLGRCGASYFSLSESPAPDVGGDFSAHAHIFLAIGFAAQRGSSTILLWMNLML